MFEELDTNKDGVISKDEFMKRHAPSDAHRNDTQRGNIDPMGRGRPGFGGPGFGRPGQGPGMSGPPSIEMIFGRMDRNHDGKITKDEVPDFLWGRLSEADADKDGAVSKAELEKHHQKMRGSQRPEGRGSRPEENRPVDEKAKTPSA